MSRSNNKNVSRKIKRARTLPEDEQLNLSDFYTKKPSKVETVAYVGLKKFRLTFDCGEAAQLTQYIEKVLNSAYAHMLTYESINLLQDRPYEIIVQMIMKIAKINSFLFPNTSRYKVFYANVVIPECVLFMNGEILFNGFLIERFLNSPRNNVDIEYSEELQERPGCLQLQTLSPQISVNSETSFKLLKLFIIADHACTHLFEADETDFIAHRNFGQSYYTIHSKLGIKILPNISTLLNLPPDFDLNFGF